MGIVRHMQSEVERACVTSRLIIGLTLSHNRNTAIVYAHSSYSDLSAIKGCWLVVIWKGGSSCWYQQGDHWPGHRSSPHPHRAGGQAAAGGTQQGEVIPYRDMHTDSQLGVRRKHATNISTSVSVGCHCTRGHLFLHHHYYLVILFFSGPVATRQSQRLGTILSIIINIKHWHWGITLIYFFLRQIVPHALNFNFLMKSNPMIYLLNNSIIVWRSNQKHSSIKENFNQSHPLMMRG